MFQFWESFLPGYKTYLVALIAILYTVLGYFNGSVDLNTTVQMVLAALGAAGLRAAQK